MAIRPTVSIASVWKRFCPSLKKSLWYGIKDIAGTVLTGSPAPPALRQGEFWALTDISLDIQSGESVGLIGPNGAGKTTLLRLIGGLMNPDKGAIAVQGRVGAMIALGTGFNPLLSGRENIFINGSVLGMSRREILDKFEEIVEFAEIGGFIDSPVRTYSSGMAMRLGFSVAAHLQPDLLLIDEVLAVGDVGFRMKCFNHLESLRQQGTAIIVVTHNMNDLSRVADRCVVLEQGREVYIGEVSRAIPEYQKLVTRAEKDDPSYSATRILKCEAESQSGDDLDSIRTGDTIRLRLTFEVGERHAGLRFIVNIANAENDSVMSVGSEPHPFESGVHSVLFVLPDTVLLEGTFHFHVSLYGPNETDYLHRLRYAASVLIGKRRGGGLIRGGVVSMPHYWEYE